jgi:dihydroxy-acid dehydratase
MVTQLSIGGSTNAIVHAIALSRRAGFPVTLDDYDRLSRTVPLLLNLRPSGKYLMEDFHRAGGLRGLWLQMRDLLSVDEKQVWGGTLANALSGAEVIDAEVIRSRANPLLAHGGTCVLRGNLAPNGCVIKTSAAKSELLQHRGPAVVFENYADLKRRIHSPELDVSPESVLVLQSAGPIGAPGFPEWGMLPIPEKLLKQGVRDMVRISDARMSGTSYGSCVLHVSPESAVGGPLAWVKTGDIIALDVPARTLDLCVSDAELDARRRDWKSPRPLPDRGYLKLFAEHVTQAHEGCDFDFLEGKSPNLEPDIF